jgi:hypothetical protein
MIGSNFRYSTIRLTYGNAGNGEKGWAAHVKFHDAGFSNDDAATGAVSVEGELRTRYYVKDSKGVSGAEAALDAILTDLNALNIQEVPQTDSWTYPTALFIEEVDGQMELISRDQRKLIEKIATKHNFEIVAEDDE